MSTRRVFPHVFYGWYVLAASFVILFLNTGGRYIVGILVKPVATEFDWSRGSISLVIFLNMAVYAFSVLVTGRLYDRYGAKWVVVGSTLLFSAGYALMATMHSFGEFLLYYGILNAAGTGGTAVPLFGSVIGHWFKKRRGLAVSLALAGSCLGQFFLLPVFSDMIDTSGWRITLVWVAGLSVGLNIILSFWVLRRSPDSVAEPEKVVAPVLPRPREEAVPAATPRDLSLRDAMQSRSLWLYTVAMFMCGGADMLVGTHLAPMATDNGLSNETAASMLAWIGLLSLVGILLAGPAADAIGNKLPIAITFALRVVLFVLLIEMKGALPFWVFSLGFGLTLLVTAPLTATLVGALYGTTHIGFISGFISTVHMIGGGMWAYIGGVIYDSTGNYDLALLLSAVSAGVALVCTLLIREVRHVAPVSQLDAPPGV